MFRFHIEFPAQYPQRPPVITFSTEIFHPLITPLTTYTYTTQDIGTDTVSASDDERLPPGGLSLRHGFPRWFQRTARSNTGIGLNLSIERDEHTYLPLSPAETPHILDVLYYLRSALMSEDFLNSIKLETAANPNAWHAWQSYMFRDSRSSSVARQGDTKSDPGQMSPRQQPGGARKPGEWNWDHVWEDRVRKGTQTSISEQALYSKPATRDELVSRYCFPKAGCS